MPMNVCVATFHHMKNYDYDHDEGLGTNCRVLGAVPTTITSTAPVGCVAAPQLNPTRATTAAAEMITPMRMPARLHSAPGCLLTLFKLHSCTRHKAATL
jgi:hypothetical protein